VTTTVTVAALLDVGGFRTVRDQAADAAESLYGAPIGDELRALFARAEGEYLGGHSFMRVFELDELENVIGQAHLYAGGLAGNRYFASDDGDGFYALTPAGAVVLVDRGAASLEYVKHCAADLVAFVKLTLEGEKWLATTPEVELQPPAPPATRPRKSKSKSKLKPKPKPKSKSKPKSKPKLKPKPKASKSKSKAKSKPRRTRR
jgi:hypothetical protein